MNVAGLNNLGFSAPAPKAAGGKPSQDKEKSSFSDALDETHEKTSDNSKDSAEREPVQASSEKPSYKPQAKSEPTRQVAGKTVAGKAPAGKPVTVKASAQNRSDAAPVPKEEQETDSAEVPAVAAAAVDPDDLKASAAPDALPSTGAPSLGNPTLNDRYLAPPGATVLVNPMAAQQPTTPQEDTANSLTRRVVWNDFLRKMNDLGVSAEDVLGAFASLSQKDLAQPPEQTVDKVVMALGLDGQQAAMAKQYFQELIAKTKSRSFGEELSSSSRQLSLTLMTQRDLQRKTLAKSIDNLDRNFFMPKPFSQPQVAPDSKQLAAQDESQGKIAPVIENDEAQAEQTAALPALAAMMQAPAQTPTAPSAPRAMSARPAEMNKMVDAMEAPSADDQKSIDQVIKNFNVQQTHRPAAAQAAMMANPQAAQTAATPGLVKASSAAPAAQSPALNAMLSAGAKNHDSASDDTSGDDNADMNGLTAQYATDNRGQSEGVKGDFQSQLGKTAAPGQPQTMAVPDLVQQAHVMVRDGGGVMKVTLHPDGLGEVAMRVSVTDGKVNVQMITESDEAKKLIERQIGDLKSGLTQNHLQVDSIKVDTATNLGKQLEQQYHDAQRQQAQANLEQFRQDHQGWRRSFFETGSVNPYRGQSDAPRDVNAPAAVSARSKGARRLDLVA